MHLSEFQSSIWRDLESGKSGIGFIKLIRKSAYRYHYSVDLHCDPHLYFFLRQSTIDLPKHSYTVRGLYCSKSVRYDNDPYGKANTLIAA